jgi:hypothetical protein
MGRTNFDFNLQRYLYSKRLLYAVPCHANMLKGVLYTTLNDSPQPHCSAVETLETMFV